ncbi:tRNA pseudouridine(38-40) synthase TruA [Fibrella aquatica]|uniref:tRNA pseudouridine(38-40) synthase TruA n=1 Tax=Fibrella aquatica TaxID=3242487 RepID=UPI00352280C6
MQRYFIELSYKGTDFHGWQFQPNGISVQQVLEETLTKRLSQPIYIVGSGRTDAGVHARQQYAHFEIEGELPEHDLLVHSLNNMLPDGIAIYRIFPVGPTDHARFSAKARYYQYHIRRQKSAFLPNQSYIFRPTLDIPLMNEAAALLLTYSNFKSFSKVRTNVNHYHCKLMRAEWEQTDESLIFHIKADRFLYGMVRCIVGTMLDIGQHRMTLDQFEAIIRAEDRTMASRAAPASGLFLTEVTYPDTVLTRRFDNG